MTPRLFDCVVGLGANLGDCRATLSEAVRALGRGGRALRLSALYATHAVGPPQPDYLNAAARFQTALEPLALLDALLELERSLGRVRRARWGPRVLDLDILWIAGLTWYCPRLTVPHPELPGRAFALLPLLDVAPEAEDPSGISYRAHLERVGLTGIRKLSDPLGSSGWAE